MTALDVLRNLNFRKYIFARIFMVFTVNMLGTIVAWQVYQITKDKLLSEGILEELATKKASFALGLIGLSEIIPFVAVTLFAGYFADIYSRKKIVLGCLAFYTLVIGYLLVTTNYFPETFKQFGAMPIYLATGIIGIIRGFLGPAQNAMSAQLVQKEEYAQAANWTTMVWHLGSIGGPAIAGLLYAYTNISTVYTVILILNIVGFFFFSLIIAPPLPKIEQQDSIFKSLKEGLDFVFNHQIILGALSLDMFAVLFGGAVAMLPVFADTILHQGAVGLGWLRAAPAVGALLMGIVLAFYPPTKKAGRNLLVCVAGFGVATILFALSTSFWWSMLALALTGAFDNVSMVIRGTISQLYTPDEMRGRVSAVNGVFIGSSNEFGAFESGVAARLLGLVPSVVFGGVMTLVTVGLTGRLAPKLSTLEIEEA
jgi:MFS family permease